MNGTNQEYILIDLLTRVFNIHIFTINRMNEFKTEMNPPTLSATSLTEGGKYKSPSMRGVSERTGGVILSYDRIKVPTKVCIHVASVIIR